MLRDEPGFQHLREAVVRNGHRVSEVIHAGYIGGEDSSEVGVIVLPDGRAYEYEFDGTPHALVRWDLVTDPAALADYAYAALMLAIERAHPGR